jgi:DNA-binding response OmpR family regulator
MREANGSHRIFVVDDEYTIASTVALVLRFHGFNTYSFTDPSDALNAALLHLPDLLITDVMMPKFSGIELALRMRQINAKCEILLFSGQASSHDLLQSARALGYEFETLHKPMHPAELLKRVEVKLGLAVRKTSEE